MTSNRRSEGDPENPETPSMAETRNWLELPPDVTSTILQKLNSFDILENAEKVCTFWRSLCKDPSMWRFIDMGKDWLMYEDDVKVTKMTMHAVDLSCGQLLDITLEATGSTELIKYIADRIVGQCDEEALAIAENMPELRHLQLLGNSCTNVGLKAILDGCPHLESLDLRQCSFVVLDQELEKVCAERIKDLLRPGDSVAGCGYPLSDKDYRLDNLPDDDTELYFDDEYDDDDDDDEYDDYDDFYLYDGDDELYRDGYAIFL